MPVCQIEVIFIRISGIFRVLYKYTRVGITESSLITDAYKRIRIAYIEAARKRPEEFEKRLNNFINKTKENKKIRGFGGIEKYYSSQLKINDNLK